MKVQQSSTNPNAQNPRTASFGPDTLRRLAEKGMSVIAFHYEHRYEDHPEGEGVSTKYLVKWAEGSFYATTTEIFSFAQEGAAWPAMAENVEKPHTVAELRRKLILAEDERDFYKSVNLPKLEQHSKSLAELIGAIRALGSMTAVPQVVASIPDGFVLIPTELVEEIWHMWGAATQSGADASDELAEWIEENRNGKA